MNWCETESGNKITCMLQQVTYYAEQHFRSQPNGPTSIHRQGLVLSSFGAGQRAFADLGWTILWPTTGSCPRSRGSLAH